MKKYILEDGDLSLKHVGEFMYVDGLCCNLNYVLLLVSVDGLCCNLNYVHCWCLWMVCVVI
jgi:hypothetical protein